MTDFAAVLWDLDGTIVDTEPIWIAAEHELAADHGTTWTEEDALQLVGNALLDSGEYIRTRLGLDLTAVQVVDYLVARVVAALDHDIPWRPGARELIDGLADQTVPQALVTMSYRAIAAPVVAHLPFQAVVTGDEVTHGKPHPEPYLRAAELLGVDAADCLAVEDSATGAASANAAGCTVVVVPHMVPVPPASRRVSLPSLQGLTPHALFAAGSVPWGV
ncbi:HAD family hydrolase [Aeromicrobium sp. CF3.5]|uniref:HAD family hydrolase n=1 Tax=Aeromicrobium sp. CF3.5 TaxID=3373078 RepID=UPI003EE810EC